MFKEMETQVHLEKNDLIQSKDLQGN